jgi:hypothetical protein
MAVGSRPNFGPSEHRNNCKMKSTDRPITASASLSQKVRQDLFFWGRNLRGMTSDVTFMGSIPRQYLPRFLPYRKLWDSGRLLQRCHGNQVAVFVKQTQFNSGLGNLKYQSKSREDKTEGLGVTAQRSVCSSRLYGGPSRMDTEKERAVKL